MLLDNQNKALKVHEWITKYTETGAIDAVTGYFTIGALDFLAKATQEKITKYRFVLGDIVNFDENRLTALNLLNENITAETAFNLIQQARKAVAFLQLNEVSVKTLEPNFCHAKLFLHHAANDERHHNFVMGSSNLTEAGMGLKITSNIELNIGETGNNEQYKQLQQWFEEIWNSPKAHIEKTINYEKGKPVKQNFKQYLIDEISKLFALYTPEQIYFKILYELFKIEENDPEFDKQMGKLENTAVFQKLYAFQRSGVISLIKMLHKYNGALLADAVGLGKTWSALAVMKYFQMQGTEVILLCPKKLEHNWRQYLKRQNSLFEADKFDYIVRFHTDLREEGMTKKELNDDFFNSDRPKLFVIDESHNLRNDKSSRYKHLVNEVLQRSQGDVKVLLLSATPINNSFKDVRNQFALMAKGKNDGFRETLDVKNLEHSFRQVQTHLNKMLTAGNFDMTTFYAKIKDSDFFTLAEHLLVARTRKSVKRHFDSNLSFPKHRTPINIYKSPLRFGNIESFDELLENMELKLSAYQPSRFTLTKAEEKERHKNNKKGEKGDDGILHDEVQRQYFLVKMMMILLFKRLESSWKSFDITVNNISNHHKNALKRIEEYEVLSKKEAGETEFSKKELTLLKRIEEDPKMQAAMQDDDFSGLLEQLTLGKKKPVSLDAIHKAGRLEAYKKAIKADGKVLSYIVECVTEFKNAIASENDNDSEDAKLQELLRIIAEKQTQPNKKILIFTAYTDTAKYLFDEFKKRGLTQFAMVTGSENREADSAQTVKKHEEVLERFAPFTKLFKEKNWTTFEAENTANAYEEWKEWITTAHPKTAEKLQRPIEILIATDVLSEGQNLQDCDMVINYDIHWNPVRVIQRVGRIDRIGSPNTEVQTINFWPAKDIDDYINLKSRVEQRMAIMQFGGAEVIADFTEEFKEIAENQDLEDRQNATMLKQMDNSMDEIDGENSLGLDDFSFDNFRQQLQEKLNKQKRELEALPNGVFSGFRVNYLTDTSKVSVTSTSKVSVTSTGLVLLLGYPARAKHQAHTVYKSLDLIYIDMEGKEVLSNQKTILEFLSTHHKAERKVPRELDAGDTATLTSYYNALQNWLKSQTVTEVRQADGTVKQAAGAAQNALLEQLKKGKMAAIDALKNKDTAELDAKFNIHNLDLVAWMVVDDK